MEFFLLLVCASVAFAKFPKGFSFGAATTAFQVEGAWLDDGKSPSIWDNMAHLPNFTSDNTAPEIAADSYHLYNEDIELMKTAGIKNYSITLSWPRIVPRGRANTAVNQKAIDHYRKMLESIIAAGITPIVTLYHWDLPAILAIQGYGILDRYFVQDLLYYADTCFKNFGDLVKTWITYNEPWCIVMENDFKKRDAATRPYKMAHNLLLGHAAVVNLYRTKYKEKYGGVNGIILNADMPYPKDPANPEDVAAVKRLWDFQLGWFADPIWFGDYPAGMKERVGDRLPKFTEEEKLLIKGSADFFALDHYTSHLQRFGKAKEQTDYWSDLNVTDSNKPEWKLTDMDWPIVPEGMHDILVYIHEKYLKGTSIPIYVTENGMANKEPTLADSVNDTPRIEYMRDYLKNVERAINDDGVDCRGYFVWSLLDNFEWTSGFSKRFGMTRVEYLNPPKRYPKASLYWYRDFIAANSQSEFLP